MPPARTLQRRPNPVFSAEYRELVAILIEARRHAGVSQRALADKLGKAASHVTMIERGQRRVDALELYRVAKALDVDPVELFRRIAFSLESLG